VLRLTDNQTSTTNALFL